MSFLQTGFLFACAAVAIPVVVHLLNRWQVRDIELGTIRFLSEIIRDGAKRRRIRRWLLLLTRMALVALLAFLFARPFLLKSVRRDGNRVRMILIDRSASMAMPGKNGRLIDDAVVAAETESQELGEDAIRLRAWFDGRVQPFPSQTSRPSAPRTVVGSTDYTAAINWARNRIEAYPTAVVDVVIITDLQHSGLSSGEIGGGELGFPSDVPVKIVDVGRPAANNLAITDLVVPSARMSQGSKVEVSATVFNFGTLPFEDAKLAMVAKCAGHAKSWKKAINVPANQAEDVVFDLGVLGAGTWELTASIDVDDDLAMDNRRWSAIEIAQPIEILVLDDEGSATNEESKSFFLVNAMNQCERSQEVFGQDFGQRLDSATIPHSQGRFRTTVVDLQRDALPTLDPSENPLVVLANASTISRTQLSTLDQFVRRGGNLLVFAGESDETQSLRVRLGGQATLLQANCKRLSVVGPCLFASQPSVVAAPCCRPSKTHSMAILAGWRFARSCQSKWADPPRSWHLSIHNEQR